MSSARSKVHVSSGDAVCAVIGKFWVELSGTERQLCIELRDAMMATGNKWGGIWLTKAEAKKLLGALPGLIKRMRDE